MDGNPKRRYGKRRYFVLAVAEPPFPPFHGCFQKTGSRVKLSHPTGSLPIRRGPRLARDDTVYSLVELVSGEPFHHFTFPPFHLKNTFPQKYRNFLHNPSYRPPLLLLDLMPSSLGHPYKL
jgi:hypothetical protein